MKKLFIAVVSALLLTSCGVGSYSVSGGKADESFVSVVASRSMQVTLLVDGQKYYVDAVAESKFKTKRNIKETARNTVKVAPGKHTVQVTVDGVEKYSRILILSNSEHRIIEI